MNKITLFKRTFIKSLTEPSYYQDVLRSRIRFGVKYIFFLLYLIVLLKALWFAGTLIPHIPKIPAYIQTAKQTAYDFFPKELTLTFNNGTLRTNVDEPYIISFPKQLNVNDYHFAVIDTKSGIENITQYKTLLFINKDSFAYYDKDQLGSSSYKVQSFADQKGYSVINYDVYERMVKQIIPFFDYAPYMVAMIILISIIILPLIIAIFLCVSISVGILFYNTFIFIMLKILKVNYSYRQLFHLGLHAVTFPLIFSELQQLTDVNVPYGYMLSYFMWMGIVIYSLQKNEAKKTNSTTA